MARLDAFIELLVRDSADQLVLEAGGGALLHRQGAPPRALLKQSLTASQVAGAVGEVLPPESKGRMPPAGSAFSYASPSGTVQVRCEQGSAGLRVVVTPLLAEAELLHDDHADFAADDAAPLELEDDHALRAPTPPRGTAMAKMSIVRGAAVSASKDPAVAMEQLLEIASQRGASDVHLGAGAPPSLRIDGALQPIANYPAPDAGRVHEMLWSILPTPAQEQYEARHAALCTVQTPVGRVRAHVFADPRGPAAALRMLPAQPLAPEQIGAPAPVLDLCHASRGLVLVASPAGGGRSSTLASLVALVQRTRDAHVLTLEQPVEVLHAQGRALVRQREVGLHVPSFAEGLRQAMRGDADVIAIDELQDSEAALCALEAAERGRLVLASIAAPTAAHALDRLLALAKDSRAQVAELFRGASAQVLCARQGGGRLAAFDVLLGTSAAATLIREDKTFQVPSLQASRANGMRTLNDALLELVKAQALEAREAWVRSPNRSELRPLLERAGFSLQ